MYKILLSGLPKYVQCSNDKSSAYQLNVIKYSAIKEYKFIQVRHDKYHKFIIIDIDDRQTFKVANDIVNTLHLNKIALPYCIVKTNKGWHIWWVLEQPVYRNNRKQMFFYKKIKEKLNTILGGDNNFAGFIARNPTLHETEVINKNVVTFNDFLTKEEFIINKPSKNYVKRRKIVNTSIDLTRVNVGERNKKMLKYLRTYAFIYFKDLTLEKFIDIGIDKNNLLPTPLDVNEVIDLCKSIFKWVEKEYKEDYDRTYIIKRNRSLAKEKKRKTKVKLFFNLIENYKSGGFNIFKFLNNNYSIYYLSKILKIDRKTVKKYYKLIKNYILIFLKRGKHIYNKIYSLNTELNKIIKVLVKLLEQDVKTLALNERWKQLYGT